MDRVENNTTTQVSSPWSGQVPFLNLGFGAAADLLGRGAQVPTVNSEIMAKARAGADAGAWGPTGSALGTAQELLGNRDLVTTPGAHQTLRDMAAGKYVGQNPYLQSTFDTAAGAVGGAMDGRFAMSNRYGSGAWAATKGKVLGDLSNQIFGGAYDADMNRMASAAGAVTQFDQAAMRDNVARRFQAAGMVPGLEQASYFPLQTIQGLEQQAIDAPWQTAMNYGRLVSGNYGGTTTGTQPYYSNPLGQGIGALGGLAGALYLGSKAFG